MNFLPEIIQDYAEAHTSPATDLLNQLQRDTHLKVMYPRMCSGHFQGRLLSLLSKMVQPQTIVEVGTYTGYATLCLAEGLQPDGKIYTIEIDPEVAAFAWDYIGQSPYKDQVVQLIGDGVETLEKLEAHGVGTVDVAFLDAHKEQYPDYYRLLLPKMRSGGLMIADNVLWSGHVVEPGKGDANTEALKAFNDLVMADERVEKVMLPVRDGLYLIRKK